MAYEIRIHELAVAELGRAHLGLAGASPDFTEAADHLDRAVDGLRQAAQELYLPRGLLARTALREAQEIAERGHMRLHEADVHLEWTWLAGATAVDLCEGEVLNVRDNAPGFFPAGCEPGESTGVDFTAGDTTGNESVEHSSVTVVDSQPPTIDLALEPDELWPPDHGLVEIEATVTVEDVCDEAPTFVLTSITSDEPDDAQGMGDGNTVNDIQDAAFGTPDLTFRLRAERAGAGNGRTYTVTYTAIDECGNEQAASATVFVPHDAQRQLAHGGETSEIHSDRSTVIE